MNDQAAIDLVRFIVPPTFAFLAGSAFTTWKQVGYEWAKPNFVSALCLAILAQALTVFW